MCQGEEVVGGSPPCLILSKGAIIVDDFGNALCQKAWGEQRGRRRECSGGERGRVARTGRVTQATGIEGQGPKDKNKREKGHSRGNRYV